MESVFGRYLDVDLTTGVIRGFDIPESWQRLHIGGKGIAARILWEELADQVDPLGPENLLVFATGPFQGTGIAGAGRHAVLAVSPKTGRVADSYAGGYFGHELGRSGYDGIIVRGESDTPVLLAIIDGRAEIVPASDLWGAGTGTTEDTLSRRYPGARVSSIGPAGERRVLQSCIINDRSRSAGRPGVGAVMGAKRLKAIAVRGSVEKPLYDRGRLTAERTSYGRTFRGEGTERFGRYGTAGGTTNLSEMGILPTRNFQGGTFEGAEAIGGVRMHETILVDRETCAGCPIRCKRVVKTEFNARPVDPAFGGPEYETVAAFGSLCLNGDLDSIALANQLCNDYGLDTISTGVAIAFLMEASERGLIRERVRWGDAVALIEWTERIARREGLGDRLAGGLQPFADEIGADFAMTIKGVEIPMHEPRGKQGLALSYATTPRGANHMEGMHDTMLGGDRPSPELGVTRPYDRFTLLDKPEVAAAFENLRSFDNSLVVCCFTTHSVGSDYNYPQVRRLFEAATGREIEADEMLAIGERNYALMRLLSGRFGHRRDEDGLPARFFAGLPDGASADRGIDVDDLRDAIAAYYEIRGYDERGPTVETLRRLDLSDLVGRAD